MHTSKKQTYKKMKKMRYYNKEFDNLVMQIENKIQQSIFAQNNPRKFWLRRKNNYNINIKVRYITSITKEQEVLLLRYIQKRYIKFVCGDFFIIEKCFFQKKYRIRSVNLYKEKSA